jgi:hypothetical protein
VTRGATEPTEAISEDQAAPAETTEQGDGVPTSRRARWAALLVPPAVAYLAGNAFYWLVAHQVGLSYFLARTHARWDSGNYLRMAQDGYTLYHCRPTPRLPFNPADWCGTVGWFPLYSMGMRGLHGLGLTYGQAGLLLAELFGFGLLVVVWWLLGARPTVTTLSCLALAALFPGSIYYHALFPVSLAVFTTLLCLGLLARGRWLLAGIAGGLSAASYQSGVLLAVVVVLWMLVTQRHLGVVAWLGRAAATSGLICLGLLFVMGLQQLEVGRWNGFLLVEEKYGTGFNNPVDTIKKNVVPQPDPPHGPNYDPDRHLPKQWAPRHQFILVSAIVLLGVVATVVRGQITPMDWAILLYTLAFWISPVVVGGHLAQYRTHALLVPCVVLVRHLPRVVVPVLVVLAAGVGWEIAVLFYRGILI